MHNYVIPQSVKDRVIKRQGKLLSHDRIEAARTALVVVDMQNYFVAEGFAAEVPAARDIVPNINRMAKALRAAGGTVVWVQTTATGALEHWANHHKHMLTTGPRGEAPRRNSTKAMTASRSIRSSKPAGRPARQEDQVQRLHRRLVRHRRAAQEPRHRHAAGHRHGDERLLRVRPRATR